MIAQSVAGLDAHGLGVVLALQGAGIDRLAELVEVAGLGPRELAATVDDDDAALPRVLDRGALRTAVRMGPPYGHNLRLFGLGVNAIPRPPSAAGARHRSAGNPAVPAAAFLARHLLLLSPPRPSATA